MNEVSIKGLRATHFDQLLAYLNFAKEDGFYYGNKKQFDTRHKELEEWLVDLCIRAKDPDCRIDKK